jgi:UPF0271 protein
VSGDVELERFGDAALRARLPARADRRAVLDALRALPRVVDAVVTEQHALVTFDPGAAPAGVAEAIARASESPTPTRAAAAAPREVGVTVRYDGPDLEEVARAAGISTADVSARHAAPLYEVVAIGFLPGFAYLRGLDPTLVLPRRSTPRTRVPALSVAIAGPYAGVYPFASPGGWHLLGTAVGFAPFDASHGAALGLGDRVRFVPVAS